MTTPSETATAGESPITNRLPRSTKKSIWWKRGEHLVQHTPTGTFYCRLKVGGKTIRVSLDTDILTTARLRLPDMIKDLRKPKALVGTFAEARAIYEADLDADSVLAPQSKAYRKARIAALLKSWPGLDSTRLNKITELDCRAWKKRFSEQWDPQNYNNTLGTLRAILERGGLGRDANPAYGTKHGSKKWRLGVPPTVLSLPELAQFDKLVETIETSGAGQAKHCADLVRFLAFSGCRISEAQRVTYADVDFDRNEITVHNAKRSRKSNAAEFRQVPIITAMRELLERLRCHNPHAPSDRVCILGECQKSLDRACKIVGIPRITHHDLRHFFATMSIESGVDIPTVSRWLGHVDGGALAMKVYGHLRREHSQSMAAKITFGAAPLPANVTPLPKQQIAR